uniref:regulatory-associated protein of mTOR-like isoform X1 n=2 Tax=Ciona intestinalis TaxID=7719 RepID=UPI00089DCC0C|nr:regulatory-associated protein of mTOR-like isoform X1 [Ciona intestinalis]|eukprot:XP_018672805.1 regulatory-associated protein of mTOR-like isoform X1 [Ciona intestinalis]
MAGPDADEGKHEENKLDEEMKELMQLPLAYTEKRHHDKIAKPQTVSQAWRMKERMKTVSVALVLCLNVGVDPPDVVKTTPCARKECWIDPLSNSPQKALENIGNTLQKQYERWQPRARYKQSLDPTVEDVKRLCTSLRRNAKEERVLFHYNGHGVPKPTANGEIWVFNKTYTQYIPLSIFDLQTWMGSPSIFVYDCSSAGLIVNSFKSFAEQREQEQRVNVLHSPTNTCNPKNCIQLAACSSNQLLPMNPELPADLFTSCLSTPIKTALQWFCHQRQGTLSPGITLDLIEKIPGRLNDRRTPLGELNWVFTAITDTIAWNILPRELFQKLFRQDLLVASLFRNFLLAERIMRSYRCTPVSDPPLPPTFRHPMWGAWDHAVDVCLSQLPQMLNEETKYVFKNSPFFAEQLTAFQVWLTLGIENRQPPEQLPIVLQVLLSQVHRLRALDLLGRFLDLGPWAVSLALSVGIFPYVLKLLQSLAKELRPLLVFIWAKILAVDGTCQSDLVKDGGHQYFLRALQDPMMSASHRTMAAFVLAEIVNHNRAGQEVCLQRNIVSISLDQLDNDIIVSTPRLKQWVAICLGRIWTNYDDARWRGVLDQAHVKLYELLDHPHPEVRASAIYSLGTFVDNQPEYGSDHAAHINQAVGATLAPLVKREASVLVRCELATALQRLVSCYDSSFAAIAFRFVEEEKDLDAQSTPSGKNKPRLSSSSQRIRSIDYGNSPANFPTAKQVAGSGDTSFNESTNQKEEQNLTVERLNRLRRISLSSMPFSSGSSYSSVNAHIWKVLLWLATDPHPLVSRLATTVVAGVMDRVDLMAREQHSRYLQTPDVSSAPNSPRSRRKYSENVSENSAVVGSPSMIPIQLPPYPTIRKVFDKGPDQPTREIFRAGEIPSTMITLQDRSISTEFCGWSSHAFAQPCNKENNEEVLEEEEREKRRRKLEKKVKIKKRIETAHSNFDTSRLGDQQFFNKNHRKAVDLTFHPYNNDLFVADAHGVSVWSWEKGQRKFYLQNTNPPQTTISSVQLINQHDSALLVVASDDGCLRVWQNCCGESIIEPTLVSAWKAMSDNIPSSRRAGLVTHWDQRTLRIYTGGDSRNIQVWDTITERKEKEFQTGADSSVTCMTLGHGLLTTGFGDGTVRLFDTRGRQSGFSTHAIHSHDTWVISTTFLPSTNMILTASEEGDIKLWDFRMLTSDPLRTMRNTSAVRQLDVHPNLSIIACGSADHSINFMNLDGVDLGSVKYYEGFLGQRLGLASCMRFHPLLANLAVGTADSYLTVYSGELKGQF